ncbi:MAG: hypothetical protein IJI92_06035 [Erysipelotrichaceae bacterium]|nr:hypothetical protein [Erysipelotrichaceae bacterium]
MIKIKFIYGETNREILVNHYKYVSFSNNQEYWVFNRPIYSITHKIDVSEYRESSCNECTILINDEQISKNDEILYITGNFDLENDLKMGSNSLSLRYLISILINNEYSDEVLQIDSMMNLLSSLMSDDQYCFEKTGINQKSISKMFSLNILKDGLRSNSIDLSYDEIIIIQLDLIRRSVSKSKRTIVIVEVLFLSETIRSYIESYKDEIIVLVYFMKTEIKDLGNKLFIDGIDFENDEKIYERMVEMTNYYNLEEYKRKLLSVYLKDTVQL